MLAIDYPSFYLTSTYNKRSYIVLAVLTGMIGSLGLLLFQVRIFYLPVNQIAS